MDRCRVANAQFAEAGTNSTGSSTFSGFYPKPGDLTWMPQGALSLRATIVPLLLVYTIVVLSGFAEGLLNATNKMIQDSFHMSKAKVAGFDAAGTAYV